MRDVSCSSSSGHRHQPTKCHRDVPSRPCMLLQGGDSWGTAAPRKGGQHGNPQGSTASQGFKAWQKHFYTVLYPTCSALSHRPQHLWRQLSCLQHCEAMTKAPDSLREFVNCTQCLSALRLPPLRSDTPNFSSLSSHSADKGRDTLVSLHYVLQLI